MTSNEPWKKAAPKINQNLPITSHRRDVLNLWKWTFVSWEVHKDDWLRAKHKIVDWADFERCSNGLKANVQKWEFNEDLIIDLLVINILLIGEHQNRLFPVWSTLVLQRVYLVVFCPYFSPPFDFCYLWNIQARPFHNLLYMIINIQLIHLAGWQC